MSTPLGSPPLPVRKLRFGLFEADLSSGELRKSGIRIRIQAQPFRVLSFLLEKPGEVVTREEIQQRLWGSDTIVDFDHSLGTAINKLREALGDSAENPRFIETLARRGYRFLAPVTQVHEQEEAPAEAAILSNSEKTAPSQGAKPDAKSQGQPGSHRRGLTVAALAAMALGGVCFFAGWQVHSHPRRPPLIRQITFSGRVSPSDPLFESFGPTATDGSRLYFPEIEEGRAVLAQALIADGETSTIPLPQEIAAPYISDISRDGSSLLLRDHLAARAEQPLWIVPTIGGGARQVPGILAHDATWMPDGQRILYANGDNLYIAQSNGSDIQKFASLPGRAFWLRWSPDGKELRFTLLNSETHSSRLWSIRANGQDAHLLLADDSGSECCGSWTADGKDYVFQKSDGADSNIWMLPSKSAWFWQKRQPYPLTNGPLNYQSPITDNTGRRIFFIGLNLRSELLQYDAASQLFIPYSGGISNASRVAFSRDGQWVAWFRQDDGSLWRSRRNGAERLQLTSGPLDVFMMQWSPNDKKLILMAREPGKRWTIYTLDADGGPLRVVYRENRSQADPNWSPDGKQIVFGRLPDLMAEASMPKAIYIYDLASHHLSKLPGSEGLFSPRWSPDGRYIAALSIDQTRLMLYDLSTHLWKTLAQQSVADPAWAHGALAIYFHDFVQPGQPLYRVDVKTGAIQKIADLRDLRAADAVDYRFAGLTPDNIPLVDARTSAANMYTMKLPEN
jgi:Tol biopolymer transport system component/DNA-binding winged helix-turn-helix (wHTH) protein